MAVYFAHSGSSPVGGKWLVEVVTLEAIFFSSRRQIGPNQRAENRYAAGYIIANISGFGAPILMSARQNTYQYTADRMVHTRSPGKIQSQKILPNQGRVSWSDFWSIFSFFGCLKFEDTFRFFNLDNQSSHPGDVFERQGYSPGGRLWSDFSTFLVRMVVGFLVEFCLVGF